MPPRVDTALDTRAAYLPKMQVAQVEAGAKETKGRCEMSEINDVGQVSEGAAKMPVLVIKSNNVATPDPCAVCGERTNPDCGPELFLEGTWELVCHQCGQKYAPELIALLALKDREFLDREFLDREFVDVPFNEAERKQHEKRWLQEWPDYGPPYGLPDDDYTPDNRPTLKTAIDPNDPAMNFPDEASPASG
jgi:hypothetical protein